MSDKRAGLQDASEEVLETPQDAKKPTTLSEMDGDALQKEMDDILGELQDINLDAESTDDTATAESESSSNEEADLLSELSPDSAIDISSEEADDQSAELVDGDAALLDELAFDPADEMLSDNENGADDRRSTEPPAVIYQDNPETRLQLEQALNKVAFLDGEMIGMREKYTRASNDTANYRKRLDKEKLDVVATANEKLLKELLPTIDTLEIALENAVHAESDEFVSGVQMVFDQTVQTLRRFGLKPFDSMGEEFDPNMHQAISLEENDEQDANTILLVLQRGYFFQERLLRPALVTVSKKSAAWRKSNPIRFADDAVEAADDAETATDNVDEAVEAADDAETATDNVDEAVDAGNQVVVEADVEADAGGDGADAEADDVQS